jgi:hypothetical protein
MNVRRPSSAGFDPEAERVPVAQRARERDRCPAREAQLALNEERRLDRSLPLRDPTSPKNVA